LDHLDRFLAADVVGHGPAGTAGLAAARPPKATWLVAFPDLHLVIEDLVVEGDRLMARLTATGTHREASCYPSTGRCGPCQMADVPSAGCTWMPAIRCTSCQLDVRFHGATCWQLWSARDCTARGRLEQIGADAARMPSSAQSS
jgi:hypothetical protein